MVITQNYDPEKVKTPLAPLIDEIAESPVFLAPQREESLRELRETIPWTYGVDAENGQAVFTADASECVVNLPLAQLERLWAMTYGFLVTFDFTNGKIPPGVECSPKEYPELEPPLALITWAYDGLKKRKRLIWPEGLPRPDLPDSCDPEMLYKVNQHFLGTTAFIILHEAAHLHYKHPSPKFQSSEESIRCENEADRWAAEWIMGCCPPKRDVRIFRGSCCVLALCLLNLLEFSVGPQSGKQTHPPTVERLLNFTNEHIQESDGPNASADEFPLYLGATILNIQRLNLGLDVARGVKHDSFTEYNLNALRVFRERKVAPENEEAHQRLRENWIQENAYFRWLERGGSQGDCLADWLAAEIEFELSALS